MPVCTKQQNISKISLTLVRNVGSFRLVTESNMKITRSHLKQTILTILKEAGDIESDVRSAGPKGGESSPEEEPEKDLKTDVLTITKRLGGYIEKIDDAAELQQMLDFLIGHFAKNPKIGDRVVPMIKKTISKL